MLSQSIFFLHIRCKCKKVMVLHNGIYRYLDTIPLIGNLAIQHYELENGLQVAIVIDRITPIFTFQTWYRTGSADEPAGKQGLAHLFEHMMFRKTKTREMGEFDRQVNINGGSDLNAYTSRDQTVYYFTFPNDKLVLAADLESDRMVNLVIDEEMFETEKGAVLTEKQRGLDDPIRFLWEEVYKLAYTTHTYKYSVIGEMDSIKGFTVEEALSFYDHFYAPNNALVIVVGDVEPGEAMNIIVRKFGGYSPHEAISRKVTTEPAQTEPRSAAVTHPKATQKMLGKSWHIPNMLHNDYPALAMVGRLLTSGKTALLTERLVNNAKVSELSADVYLGRDLGTFELFTQLAPQTPFDEVETIFYSTAKELADENISDDQMTIVKNNLMKETYDAATTPSSLGQKIGDGFINTNDLAFQLRAIDRINNVSKEDIGRVVNAYLLQGKATTVQLTPESKPL